MNEIKKYKFCDLYDMASGISSTKGQAGHGAPFLSFGTVFNNYFLPENLIDKMDTTIEEQNTFSIKKGDVFVTRTSETIDELAMSSVALKDYPNATYSGFVKRLRPKTTGIVYDKFLAFYLRSKLFRKTMTNNATMTLRASFNEDIFSFLYLYLPPYEEQKKIGDLLYNIEMKMLANKKINDNLAETIKAIFKSWFLDFNALDNAELVQSQYGLIPKGWHYESLGNLCECVTKGTTPTTLGKDFTKTGINFIKGESINDDHSFNKSLFAHIDDETDELLKRSRICENDIVFTIAGTLGKFALVDSSVVPANTNQAVAIIRTSKISPEMLYSYFVGGWQVEFYKRNTQQAVQANLSLGTIKDLPILLPDDNGQIRYMGLIKPIITEIKTNFAEIERLYDLQNQILTRLSSRR